ncbi:MAG: Ig-like domain-containing protein, partial [Nitrosotalea sp.]
VLYASVNQTGVYSVLIHAPLFGGRSIVEPVTIATKFSTILPIESQPQMIVDIPIFINSNYTIIPKIIGQDIEDEQYSLDNAEPKIINQTLLTEDVQSLSEGEHNIKFTITDTVGHYVSKEFKFIIDNTAPQIVVKSPKNNSQVSGVVNIDLDVNELNLAQKDWLTVQTPKHVFHDVKNIQFDTTTMADGNYTVLVTAKDRSGNVGIASIMLNVDNSSPNIVSVITHGDQNFITLVEVLAGIGIASTVTIFTFKRLRISKRG